MEILGTALLLVIIGAVIFLRSFLQKLPERINSRSLATLQSELSRELEVFRAQLVREIEAGKISLAETQKQKTAVVKSIQKYYGEMLSGKRKGSDFDPATERELTFNIGVELFLYMSDDSINKYLKMRHAFLNYQELNDPLEAIRLFGEAILAFRRDMGYTDTELEWHHFTKMFLVDKK